ncbi:MAG: ribosome biogenesis GTPase Der [Erysipelothrix sp.]|jgi:GTP-binding protein|nr:ribosome biogenesis GTPase Der [Erysipelothrix sp.]
MIEGIVAIVGQPNVGKSTLFNRLIGERSSIVLDEPGVTRDRLYGVCNWLTKDIRVIDTGGIVLKDEMFKEEVMMQVEIAIDEADVIIYVVDAQIGISQNEHRIAKTLHKSKKPVIVAVNKIDDVAFQDRMYEFYNLGFTDVFAISSIHAIGVGDLLDRVVELLPQKHIKAVDGSISFSIIGKPNVGKSSIVNALLNQQRVIVSDIPGTTRDAIDSHFKVDQQDYVVIDTAGIRKRGKIYEKIEKYALLRSLSAIERSDVVCFVLDASEPITELDKHVAGYAHNLNKPIIILLNKWDVVDKEAQPFVEFEKEIKNAFGYMAYAPILSVSALSKQRIHQIIPLINEVYENATNRIATSVLNEILIEAMMLNPPPVHKGKRLKVYYMTQIDVLPPTFILHVNDQKLMHFSYQRYLENKIRDTFDFTGTSLLFKIKQK